MSINVIKEEIEILVETISEQYNVIKQYKSSIPQIEIDIMMSNIRDLYVFIDELNKINKIKESFIENRSFVHHHELKHTDKVIEKKTLDIEEPEKIHKKESVIPEIHSKDINEVINIEDPIKSDIIIEKEEVLMVEEKTDENTIIDIEELSVEEKEMDYPAEELNEVNFKEDLFASVNDVVSEKKEIEKTKKQEKSSLIDLFAGSDKTIVADKFKDDKVSLNQKLGEEKKEKTLADKMQKKPIKDLKSAIGINDKFIFINDLFKGSLQEYNHSIEKMNACASVDEAFKIIEELKEKYSWDENLDVYVKLEDFIIRKFM